jgi:hypothetical protein
MKSAWGPAALLAAAVGGCGTSDPETEIRGLVAAAEQAAEERDHGFFRSLIGSGYRDSQGNDRDRLLALLRGYFLSHSSFEIVSRVDAVDLQGGDAARVVVQAGMVGRRAGEPLLGGLDGELYHIELELVGGAGDWQVIGATWRRGAGE